MTANHIARMSAKRLTLRFGDDLPFADETNKARTLSNLAGLKGEGEGESKPRPSLWRKLRRAFT